MSAERVLPQEKPTTSFGPTDVARYAAPAIATWARGDSRPAVATTTQSARPRALRKRPASACSGRGFSRMEMATTPLSRA